MNWYFWKPNRIRIKFQKSRIGLTGDKPETSTLTLSSPDLHWIVLQATDFINDREADGWVIDKKSEARLQELRIKALR